MMLAFRINDASQPPSLIEIPEPVPKPGQVKIKIEACGLNFADLLMVNGTYQDTPAAPFTLGLEACGIVTALGDGVTTPAIGDRVAVFAGQGGLAQLGCFEAQSCLPVPDTMPPDIAAGFQIAYGTSHLALTRRARLQPGETLVVLGAAGGVGLTAVELGKILKAKVIAVARGAEKLSIAARAGADHLIDSTQVSGQALTDEIRALGGADVVYDAVGGDAFDATLRATNREGRILSIGFASGTVPQIPANHLLVKNIDVSGVYWGGYLKFAPDALRGSLNELMAMFSAGKLRPHISHTLNLKDVAKGLDLLKTRQSTGKVVITM